MAGRTPTNPKSEVAPLKSLSLKDTTGAGTDFPIPVRAGFSVHLVRATTGAAGGSTSASVRLQGSWDGTNWTNISAAVVCNSASAGVVAKSTNTIGVPRVRLSITSFTTSASANPDKVKVTGRILVHDA